MRFSGPDAIVEALYRKAHRLSSIQSSDPTDGTYREYAPRCACGHKTRLGSYAPELGQIIERCARCSLPWPWKTGYVPRGTFQRSPRPGRHDAAFAEFATLVALLERLPAKDRLLYMLFLHPEHGGYDWAAQEARGRLGTLVTRHTVRAAVQSARDRLRWEAERCGMILPHERSA